MKKKLLAIVLSVVSFSVMAQYVPTNSQAFQFLPIFNPAFSGVENFGDLKLSYRYQWAGFEGAPKFINLSYNSRLKQPLDMSYNSFRGSNTSTLSQQELPRMKGMIFGFGANIFQYKDRVLNSIGGSFNFSVNYPLNKTMRLAAGVSSLIENRKMNVREIAVRDPDPFYEHLLRSSTTQTDLNVRVGALLYADNFYLGVSYLPLVNIALQSSDLAMEKAFYTASLQAGYAIPLNEEIMLKPSILALLQMDNGIDVSYSMKAFIQNKVFLGLTYRNTPGGVLLLGFNIDERFTASYSYEMSLGNFQKFNDGSHELVLAARLKNLRKYTQYIW